MQKIESTAIYTSTAVHSHSCQWETVYYTWDSRAEKIHWQLYWKHSPAYVQEALEKQINYSLLLHFVNSFYIFAGLWNYEGYTWARPFFDSGFNTTDPGLWDWFETNISQLNYNQHLLSSSTVTMVVSIFHCFLSFYERKICNKITAFCFQTMLSLF